jgi:hypothetical protein
MLGGLALTAEEMFELKKSTVSFQVPGFKI